MERDAYLHPTVDDSDEPFKWGLPDLDALRECENSTSFCVAILTKICSFLSGELGWSQVKVDELLLPIIQKMRKRQQVDLNNEPDGCGIADLLFRQRH